MNRKSKGYSLIELQVASIIGFITLLAILALYIFSWRSFSIGNTILDVYLNSRNAVGLIATDIRCASQVISSYGPYTTTDHRIVLMVPSVDSTGNAIPSHYDYIVYQLQGTDIYRIVQHDALSARPNENRAIAHYCSTLTFSSGGVALSSVANLSTVDTVGIYLPINETTISLSGGGGAVASITPTTVIKLRNK